MIFFFLIEHIADLVCVIRALLFFFGPSARKKFQVYEMNDTDDDDDNHNYFNDGCD